MPPGTAVWAPSLKLRLCEEGAPLIGAGQWRVGRTWGHEPCFLSAAPEVISERCPRSPVGRAGLWRNWGEV